MTKGRPHFVGLAGQYYVAYCLGVREHHAAIIMGNVPGVDILISSAWGAKQLTLQVKTSRNAYRPCRYGYELREWDVSVSAPGQSKPNLWYAFVDLQESESSSWNPIVFLIPSSWVGAFVQKEYTRKMYLLRSELWPSSQERWDRIYGFFFGDKETLEWLGTVPEATKPWQRKP